MCSVILFLYAVGLYLFALARIFITHMDFIMLFATGSGLQVLNIQARDVLTLVKCPQYRFTAERYK